MSKLFILSFLIFVSCTNKKNREYASMRLVSSGFTNNDVESLMNQKKYFYSETEFKRLIHASDMKKDTSFTLNKSKQKILVSMYDRRPKELIICYSNNASVKLLVYSSGTKLHDEQIFVLKDFAYREIIEELITNDLFIVNKINSPMPFTPIEKIVKWE